MVDLHLKLEYFARMLLPALATLMFSILVMVPVGVVGIGNFPPDVCLISIYYWTIFRPTAMPFWFVFLLGIMQDALFGIALGMSSLLFLLFRLLILSQLRHLTKESFWMIWIGFGLITIPMLFCQWVMASAYKGALLPWDDAAMQWAFTFGLYPLLHVTFNTLYRLLPPAGTGSKSHAPLL